MRKAEQALAMLTLVGTLMLGACNVLQTQKPNDKAITSDVLAKFYQDPVLKTRDVKVVSEQGVVVLTGAVGTDAERAEAERLAGQVSGVKQVINQLNVSGTSASSPSPPETPVQQVASSTPPASTRLATRAHSRPARRYDDGPPPRVSQPAPMQQVEPPIVASAPVPAAAPSRPAPEPVRVTIPAGTVITVRMIDAIDSARNHAGDEFAATLEAPVVVGDRVVIPRDSDARVRLVEARSAGHMTGRSELEVELTKVANYPVETSVKKQEGASRGKRSAETVGGGAAVGALIGAIAGKGKGAAIGAAVGAGAGTAAQAATRGQQVRIPSETKLDFTLRTAITVTM